MSVQDAVKATGASRNGELAQAAAVTMSTAAVVAIAAYTGAQLLSNIASLKIGIVFGLAVDMGTFIYPITFTLRDVAQSADGLFFEASDAEALTAVYQRIDQVLPRTVKTVSYRPKRTLVFVPAGTALALCLVFGAFTFFRRKPRRREMAEA